MAVGLAVRLIPAYFVYGSFDVGAWELVIREFREGHNPYTTGKLNWPPLWPMLLFYTKRMEDVYGLPTHFSVKIIPCVADASIAVVLYLWFARSERVAVAFRKALWYALNPVAIVTCSMQGQFESLPSLCSVLAIISISRARTGKFPLVSAVWLGLGGLAKTWPLFLSPAFLRVMPGWKRRFVFLLIAFAPAVIGVGLLYLYDPEPIAKFVLSYRGRSGVWGLTSLDYLLPPRASAVWNHFVLWVLYGAWGAVYFATRRCNDAARVACLGVLTFYVFTSGLRPQYFVWVLAISLIADFQRARLFTTLASATVGIYYVFMPYNGELFTFVSRNHTRLYWANLYGYHHLLVGSLVFLPLWVFCVWWWAALLREARAGAPERSLEPVR